MQALWMVLGAFFFSTMAVGVRIASAGVGTAELLFYRSVVGVLFLVVLLRAGRVPLRTPVPAMHLWRGLLGSVAIAAWFYSLVHLPIVTSMALNYMSGVWLAAFVVGAALLAGRQDRQGPMLATVLLGFAGVVLLLQPTLAQNQLFAGLIGLLSGVAAALAYLQVGALGRAGEPELRTVFYFSVVTTVTSGLAALATGFTPWSAMPWQSAAWLVPIGVLASLGQWCMTRAFSRGHTLLAANLQYSGVLFAALYGLWLFDDRIPPGGWIGLALVVGSGIAATVLRAQAVGARPAEEH
ncbi:MAG: DMT family transporter [Rhodoferax sp.]|nr:DMT family transporter [Rhodoferax sp.]